MRKVGRINPVARALLRSRRNTSTVDSKKRYNRKKDKANEEWETMPMFQKIPIRVKAKNSPKVVRIIERKKRVRAKDKHQTIQLLYGFTT